MRTVLSVVASLVLVVLSISVSAEPSRSGQAHFQTSYRSNGSSSWTVLAAPPLPEASTAERSARPLVGVPPLKAQEILEAVQKRHGEPLPGYAGGRTFHNRERILPPGHYREYDVNPRIAGRSRGPERLVIEQRTGKAYYTGDHYVTFIPMN
ncbi:ribonuclease domain-containing protein [Nitrospira sp. Nam74]